MASSVEQAAALIAKICGKPAAALAPADDLVVDLAIDSAKALELLIDLEEVLGIEISDEDAARFESVGDILTYVEAQA